ncbi:MAG: GDSL-type esterase/lipase family protein [Methyloligellaceae bacterium]
MWSNKIINKKDKNGQVPLYTIGSVLRVCSAVLCAMVMIGQDAAFANDTSRQVNRVRKADQLPIRQKKVADDIEALKRMLPKKNSPTKLAKTEKITPTIIDLPPQPSGTINLIKDTPIKIGLAKFFRALGDVSTGKRNEPVTILHLGDEHIARDKFTGDLREMFQARFGNSGRGMTMPGPVFPFFRARGIRIASTGKWEVKNSLSGKKGELFGLTGVTYTSSDPNASVQFNSTGSPFAWAEISFFTGPEYGRAIVWAQGPDGSHQQIIETNTLQYGMRRVRFPKTASSISVFPEGGKPITVMSWQSGHDKPGVRYVNLGVPGATVGFVQNLDAEFVQRDIQSLKPSLIILNYGTNEGFDPITDAKAYEKKFNQLVQIFKSLAPEASVMVIGPPDAAFLPDFARRSGSSSSTCSALSKEEIREYNTLMNNKSSRLARWHPPLNLDPVRRAMRRAAAGSAVYFWDWSQAMGGACGIHAWVHASPKKATDDHRALTAEGGKESAKRLFNVLMAGFDAYRRIASR